MPQVGGKQYKYNAEGMAAAAAESRRTGQPIKITKYGSHSAGGGSADASGGDFYAGVPETGGTENQAPTSLDHTPTMWPDLPEA